MLGVCECLLYGYKAGLDLNLLLETIGAGAASSFSVIMRQLIYKKIKKYI